MGSIFGLSIMLEVSNAVFKSGLFSSRLMPWHFTEKYMQIKNVSSLEKNVQLEKETKNTMRVA